MKKLFLKPSIPCGGKVILSWHNGQLMIPGGCLTFLRQLRQNECRQGRALGFSISERHMPQSVRLISALSDAGLL